MAGTTPILAPPAGLAPARQCGPPDGGSAVWPICTLLLLLQILQRADGAATSCDLTRPAMTDLSCRLHCPWAAPGSAPGEGVCSHLRRVKEAPGERGTLPHPHPLLRPRACRERTGAGVHAPGKGGGRGQGSRAWLRRTVGRRCWGPGAVVARCIPAACSAAQREHWGGGASASQSGESAGRRGPAPGSRLRPSARLPAASGLRLVRPGRGSGLPFDGHRAPTPPSCL